MPFCSSRCGYCDFNTYAPGASGAEHGLQSQWSIGAVRELELLAATYPGQIRPFDTVFVGGGTPSLIDPKQVASAITAAREVFGFQEDIEITAEANPESFTEKVAEVWRSAGVNRISFGMQSAAPHVLAELDRSHAPDRVNSAYSIARDYGFANLSVDLIYGARGESLADWRRTVEVAIALEPDHISAYSLTVEKGTALGRRVKAGQSWVDDGDAMAVKYEIADELFGSAGYQWYEISNWAKSGFECRHNLGYWRNHDWFGVGPGAHSHLLQSGGVTESDRTSTRWWNVKHPTQWQSSLAADRLPVESEEILSLEQRSVEEVMLGVRLREGLAASLPEWLHAELLADELIEASTAKVVLTRRGRLLADTVTHKLINTCLPTETLLPT